MWVLACSRSALLSPFHPIAKTTLFTAKSTKFNLAWVDQTTPGMNIHLHNDNGNTLYSDIILHITFRHASNRVFSNPYASSSYRPPHHSCTYAHPPSPPESSQLGTHPYVHPHSLHDHPPMKHRMPILSQGTTKSMNHGTSNECLLSFEVRLFTLFSTGTWATCPLPLLLRIVSKPSSHLTEDAPELVRERRESIDVVDKGRIRGTAEEAFKRTEGQGLWLG